MANKFQILTALTSALSDRLPLDVLLQQIVDSAAQLLANSRVSLRLLDPTRTRLLTTMRVGAPAHLNPGSEFHLGEGLIGWIAENSAPLRTGNAAQDARFVPREDIREPFGSFLGVPLVSGRTCMGVLSVLNREVDHFTERDEELLTLVAGICAPHVEVARLERLSQVDPLTGALNRRGLDLAFPAEGDMLLDRPIAVVMVDIDHFKRINDEYGHVIGDEVLKRVAHILNGVLREGDIVVRYGGEEFLLLLTNVGLAVAGRVAERARAAVEQSRIDAAGMEIRMTISVGVADRLEHESRDELIARADAALYAAKHAGRNRVVSSERRGERLPRLPQGLEAAALPLQAR